MTSTAAVLIGMGLIVGVCVTVGTALGIAVLVFALCIRAADKLAGD